MDERAEERRELEQIQREDQDDAREQKHPYWDQVLAEFAEPFVWVPGKGFK